MNSKQGTAVVSTTLLLVSMLLCGGNPASGMAGRVCGNLMTSQPAVADIGDIIHAPGTACVDSKGVPRAVDEEWTEDCDCNVCIEGVVQNHTVVYSCRQGNPQDNPDAINCDVISDPAQAFPNCCPYLVCDPSPTLPSFPDCYDRADDKSCSFWRGGNNEGCIPSHRFYNFTNPYCRLSCGFCTV